MKAKSPLQRLLDDFLAPLRAAHDEQRTYLASDEGRRFDMRTAGTLLVVAVMLTLQHYVFDSGRAQDAARLLAIALPSDTAAELANLANDPGTSRIAALTYWGLGQTLIYLAIPAVVVKLVFRDSLADYGLKLRGAFKCAWVYGLIYLAIAGPVL